MGGVFSGVVHELRRNLLDYEAPQPNEHVGECESGVQPASEFRRVSHVHADCGLLHRGSLSRWARECARQEGWCPSSLKGGDRLGLSSALLQLAPDTHHFSRAFDQIAARAEQILRRRISSLITTVGRVGSGSCACGRHLIWGCPAV